MARRLAIMLGFHTRQMFRNSYFAQLILLTPACYIAMKALAARSGHETISGQVWLEGATVGMWALSTMAAGMIGYQRFQGTLPYLARYPGRPAGVFGPLIASTATAGLACIPVAIAVALACGGSIDAASPAIIIPLAATYLGCVAMALAIAVFFLLSRHALVYESLLVVPIWLVSGVVTPYHSLPAAIKLIALASPLTGAMEAGRQLSTGAGLPARWIIASLLATGLWLILARFGLANALSRAFRKGDLALT